MGILSERFEVQKTQFNLFLTQVLPSIKEQPTSLHEAMHYVVLNGGKRLRPLLVYLSGEILNTPIDNLHHAACAVEFIHAYSLVHDDLPAMDDDDFRRGQPTCHKVFGEATAILVGDALQALAFEVLSQSKNLPEKLLRMVKVLSHAVGSFGMVGGQSLDLSSEGKKLELKDVELLHRWKTGALIEASVELGILASENVDENSANHLREFARCFGLGFQIRDDIQDIEGNIESLGKTPQGDIKHQKSTYPAVIGLENAKFKVNDLYKKASENLKLFGDKATGLRNLLDNLLLLG